MRANQRLPSETRKISISKPFNLHAEGAVLIEIGETKVFCTASIQEGVPPFLKGSGSGWLTAEYGMLPRSTKERMPREAAKGKQSGRTQEIQRLIGRSLRQAINLQALGERTVIIDCDVLQADGGTRTAAITGGCIALHEALIKYQGLNLWQENPFKQFIAAISVGMANGIGVLDLDYVEDVNADTDMNVVMTEHGGLIEIQGTAEKQSFTREELEQLLTLAMKGIDSLIQLQKQYVKS